MATLYYAGDSDGFELLTSNVELLTKFQSFGRTGSPTYVSEQVDGGSGPHSTAIASLKNLLALDIPAAFVQEGEVCLTHITFDDGSVIEFKFNVALFVNSADLMAEKVFENWLENPVTEERILRVDTSRSSGFAFDASRTVSIRSVTPPMSGQLMGSIMRQRATR